MSRTKVANYCVKLLAAPKPEDGEGDNEGDATEDDEGNNQENDTEDDEGDSEGDDVEDDVEDDEAESSECFFHFILCHVSSTLFSNLNMSQ